MTRDDITEMVREAREQTMKELPPNTFDLDLFHERFAVLVAAQEREACAKVCEDDPSKAGEWTEDAHTGGYYAEIIRARGLA